MKYLILGLIIYVFYRFFLQPKRISTREQQHLKNKKEEEEGDYVDYEEIE